MVAIPLFFIKGQMSALPHGQRLMRQVLTVKMDGMPHGNTGMAGCIEKRIQDLKQHLKSMTGPYVMIVCGWEVQVTEKITIGILQIKNILLNHLVILVLSTQIVPTQR